MRAHISCLVLILAAVMPAAALAQTAPPSRADATFQQGREAMSKRDFKGALDHLRESQKLEPGRGKLLNIAICEEEIGLWGSALRHFEEVLPQLAGDPRATLVKEHIDKVRPRVPYLRIGLAPGAPKGTTVTLDGDPVAASSLGTELPVDPGKHVVTASAVGGKVRRFEVTLAEGAHGSVAVEPERGREASAVVAAPTVAALGGGPGAGTDAPPRSLRWKLGIGALGAGGATLVVGAITGGLAVGKHATLASGCKNGDCPGSLQPTHDAFKTLANVSTATVIVGAALAATGVVLVVTAPGAKPREGAWVAPRIGVGVIGLEGGF